jgi:hypothetical protein
MTFVQRLSLSLLLALTWIGSVQWYLHAQGVSPGLTIVGGGGGGTPGGNSGDVQCNVSSALGACDSTAGNFAYNNGTKVLTVPSINVTNNGPLIMRGATSGAITIQPQSVAGTYTLTLPNSAGGASQFLQTDGAGNLTWAAAGTSFANPTASVGLTAVNGAATTAMRSDAAPALSQSIVPTWTGTHTFNNTIVAVNTFMLKYTGDNRGVNAGNGAIYLTNSGGQAFVSVGANNVGWNLGGTGILGWATNTDGTSGTDTGFARNAAGVVELNNGTAGTYARIRGNYIASSPNTPSVANVGANSCGTTAATLAGNDNAFTITVGATAATQCRVTMTTTAPNEWECAAPSDDSQTIAMRANPVDTTHVDVFGAMAGGDKVTVLCFPR